MTIELYNEIDNSSIAIGDTALYSVVQTFGTSTDNPDTNVEVGGDVTVIGTITGISGNVVTVDNPSVSNVPVGAFLLFQKSNLVNNSGLKGYYASVMLENNSTDPAELFAVSSEATESSK